MTDERNNDILPVKISGITGPVTGWLDGHTILLGLFANPIRHSVSPTMHNNAMAKLGLNGAYLCFEIGPDRIEVELATRHGESVDDTRDGAVLAENP